MAKPSRKLAALFTPVLAWLDRGGHEEVQTGGETLDLGFNMKAIFLKDPIYPVNNIDPEGRSTRCGSICCIVGAVGVFNPDLRTHPSDSPWAVTERANNADSILRDIYGMTKGDSKMLFYPNNCMPIDMTEVTPAEAAITIRNWIKTGVVDWSHSNAFDPVEELT